MSDRENTYAALLNVRDHFAAFLSQSAADFAVLGADADEVRQELDDRLRDLLRDQMAFVADGYDGDPLSAGTPYGRAAA